MVDFQRLCSGHLRGGMEDKCNAFLQKTKFPAKAQPCSTPPSDLSAAESTKSKGDDMGKGDSKGKGDSMGKGDDMGKDRVGPLRRKGVSLLIPEAQQISNTLLTKWTDDLLSKSKKQQQEASDSDSGSDSSE